MEIPQKLINKWKALRTAGDAVKMAEKVENGYAETFNRAFRIGRCSDDVFKIMAEFYEEKANLVKEYL